MATFPLPRHALAGGPPSEERPNVWPLSRRAMAASIVAHVVLLLAAAWWYWNEAGVAARVDTRFVWVTALPPPDEAAAPEAFEPVTPEAVPEPIVTQRPVTPRAAAPRPVSPPPAAEPAAESVAPLQPAPAPGPSRLDLDAARREAVAAVVRQRERDRNMLEFDATPPPPERTAPAAHKPSIFDHQAGSSRSFLSPAKARTAVGQRLSLWCSKMSGGGFGFFGIPICASGRIEPPSGLFVESIPEYMRLKPDCDEPPLAAALGEAVPRENVKCRLVPKAPDE